MTDNLNSWMEVYNELSSEIEENTTPAMESINDALSRIGPMPEEAVMIGVCRDGMPVLLNLHDPIPKSLVVIGDNLENNKNILRVMAKHISIKSKLDGVEFAVLSRDFEGWDFLNNSKNLSAAFQIIEKGADDLILSLASWAHGNINGKQSVVLLIDDLGYAMEHFDFDTLQNLRWLLLRGSTRRCWIISSVKSSDAKQYYQLIEQFGTRVYSKIHDSSFSRVENSDLTNLENFVVREGSGWCNFYTPAIF